MTPEYIRQLADLADPNQLWRLSPLEALGLPEEDKRKLDTGVALRRHAAHLQTLNQVREEKRSLLLTPIRANVTASRTVETPSDHERLRFDYTR